MAEYIPIRLLIQACGVTDESVDLIVSNCVINLSTDKREVLAEAYRVLREVSVEE